jgi:hypothetical protein
MAHGNFHPCSNYYGPGRAAPAISAMVLWGIEGEAPKKPESFASHATGIPPVKGYKPGKGVAVVDFAPGKTPQKWLLGGPLESANTRDLLKPIGGFGGARPETGTKSSSFGVVGGRPREVTVTFKPLEAKFVDEDGVDVGQLADEGEPVTLYLYTVLKVDEEQLVGVANPRKDVQIYLGGTPTAPGAFYRLEPGLYPMLVVHASEKASGKLAPRLATIDDPAFDTARARYELGLALNRHDYQAWKKHDGADPRVLHWFLRGWRQVYRHYRLGMGDGGFQAETGGYANIASWYPLVYANLYYNFAGRRPSAHPDVSHLVPRRMMQMYWPGGGKTNVLKMNSATGFESKWWAAAYPIVPEKYRPSVLWTWNAGSGADAQPKTREAILAGDGLAMALEFINYPLDAEPVHPSEGMPLHWAADTFGFYVFRSGWQGKDEFISQAFAKANLISGWNHPNAGALRLWGLGHVWAMGPTSRAGFRPQECVVLLPEDDINQSASGRVTHRSTRPNGGGALTIDYRDVYSRGKMKDLIDGNLIRHPEKFKPSGISGFRAVGWDYSGAAGAPCLMVVADKVSGGGKKLWTWQIPQGAKVKINGNRFTFDHGDATMTATFVTPGDVKIEAAHEQVKLGKLGSKYSYEGGLHRIKATGGDAFLVVITVQRGDAPKVSAEGDGLDAKVTVTAPDGKSKQTVRLDGEKVIFGK